MLMGLERVSRNKSTWIKLRQREGKKKGQWRRTTRGRPLDVKEDR
jgi:hypothetical protein